MSKTDNTKISDSVFSLKNDEIIEWEIFAINPKNERFFVIVNKETGSIEQIHWKLLEYGTDRVNFFSLSKSDLLERYKLYSEKIIAKLSGEI